MVDMPLNKPNHKDRIIVELNLTLSDIRLQMCKD